MLPVAVNLLSCESVAPMVWAQGRLSFPHQGVGCARYNVHIRLLAPLRSCLIRLRLMQLCVAYFVGIDAAVILLQVQLVLTCVSACCGAGVSGSREGWRCGVRGCISASRAATCLKVLCMMHPNTCKSPSIQRYEFSVCQIYRIEHVAGYHFAVLVAQSKGQLQDMLHMQC